MSQPSIPATPDDDGDKPLTPEQFRAGLSEARRIVTQAAGYYFARELVPFAEELKSLALRALKQSPPPEPPAVLDSVPYWRDKAMANGAALDRAWDALKANGVLCDGNTALSDAITGALSRTDRDGEARVPRPHAELDDTKLVNAVTPDMLLGLEEVCGFGLADYPDLRTALCDAYNRAASPGGTDG